MAEGRVWLVGAGPGDPGLITVRGLEVLSLADVVLHDALSHPALLEACPSDAEVRDVGKLGGRDNPDQDWITTQLVQLARAGKRVVRLKGGDSFLFARGAEEAEALARAGVPFEVVPGLSSPVGTSAYAGIPLTHRDLSSSVTFITGTDKAGSEWSPEAWRRLATATETICILMGMRRLQVITQAIIDGGRSPETPAAVIQWGARPDQRVLSSTLARIAAEARAANLRNPAVVIVGEVVSLREHLSWYDTQPLFGRRILVPRAAHQARDTCRAIRARGAEAVAFPTIEIVAPPDPAAVDRVTGELGSYDWVLFTSANGVRFTFDRILALGRDARAFGGASIGVIGPKTELALRDHGLRADVIARDYIGEGLARAVLERGVPRRVLLLRALEARDALPRALAAAGAHVDVIPVYETLPVAPARANALRSMIERREIDTVIFTSSSVARSFAELLGRDSDASGITVASIGPVTSATLREHGLEPAVEADAYTVDGVLDALERASRLE